MWKMIVFAVAVCMAAAQAQPAQLDSPQPPKATQKEEGPKRRINLLPLFSTETSSVDSEWRIKNGRIVGDDRGCARIEFPFLVPDEYDYNITFSAKGRVDPVLILSMKGKQFLFLMGSPWCLEFVKGKGKRDKDNPTTYEGKIQSGVPVKVEAKIRSNKVDVAVNGELVVSYETNGNDLGENKDWALPHKGTVGVGGANSPMEIISAEIVEVSGRGEKIDRTIRLRPPQ